jgi:hypothetical protein
MAFGMGLGVSDLWLLGAPFQLSFKTPSFATNISACFISCTLFTTCFGPDQWPSSGDTEYSKDNYYIISTDPLRKYYVERQKLWLR